MNAGAANLWTPSRIARDVFATVQDVEKAAAAANVSPVMRVNCIAHYDDDGRARILEILTGPRPGVSRNVRHRGGNDGDGRPGRRGGDHRPLGPPTAAHA